MVRLELLKATVRLDRETHSALYAAADDDARTLAIDAPITLYQAPGAEGANAALWFLPGEAHVILRGPVATALAALSAAAYLAQADEIFARAEPTTEGLTHPETFIRARARPVVARGSERRPRATPNGETPDDSLAIMSPYCTSAPFL